MSLNGYSVADAVSRIGTRGGSYTEPFHTDKASKIIAAAARTGVRVKSPVGEKPTKVDVGVTVARPPFESMWIELEFLDGGREAFAVWHTANPDGGGTVQMFSVMPSSIDTAPQPVFGTYGVYLHGPDGVLTEHGFPHESQETVTFLGKTLGMGYGEIYADQFAHCIFAIALMNCKNVSLVDAPLRVKPPSKKQRRKRTPALTFKTIKLPGGSSSGGEGTGEPGETARHIVRGNFATYTDDNPLFGNITGTFWRPAHVRGKTKHGIVQKDYEVVA